MKGGTHINYNTLYTGEITRSNLPAIIAHNRGLPDDWCKREFTQRPSFDFAGLKHTCATLLSHIIKPEIEKFQIVVDSDLDGICSAAIFYKFIKKYYPNLECVYSIHTGKQHGLRSDIKIDKDTTLVVLPDAGSNDVEQCKDLLINRKIDVICLDHHIIEQPNQYASIVSCMDGEYPNQHLCGAAVTWLFLYGFCYNCISFFDEHHSFLLDMLDLVGVATISDIMDVTNEDNMFFIQNGLKNITSKALKTFLESQEIPIVDVTIEHIKYKVSPLISAMMRMGSIEEKTLLFRAFIDDYEEFDYEKRGSLGVEIENIYDRVVRLCKNAKGRQDRAKQKLLEECQVHEYPHVLLVEYEGKKSSTLTGLVANELANQYCKPCIVYRNKAEETDEYGNSYDVGSIRNYDGSPILSFKKLLEDAFKLDCSVSGHENAAGSRILHLDPDLSAELIEKVLPEDIAAKIGTKEYNVDFEVDADEVDAGFIRQMSYFDHYSGYGFAPVTVLVKNIIASSETFSTMGKSSLNWKILYNDVSYTKFKIQKDDRLVELFDDVEWDSEEDYGDLTDGWGKKYYIDAICTFGFNVYKGIAYPQAIVKDYVVRELVVAKCEQDEDDFDLDFDL